jgi:hypothetical protein
MTAAKSTIHLCTAYAALKQLYVYSRIKSWMDETVLPFLALLCFLFVLPCFALLD